MTQAANLTRPLLPDLECLRCFMAAAKHLNFRVAAEVVGLSPAAFSDRIRRLEEALGGSLFTRTTRKVALTSAGRRLLPEAQRCLAAAHRCDDAVRSRAAEPPYDLTIGTRYELGMSWLTPGLSRLESNRPERRLHLYFGDTPELLRLAKRDSLDAFVTSARITDAGLSFARLHEERYVFVGAKQLVRRQPLTKREHCGAHTLLELHGDLPLFRYFLDARPADEVWGFSRVQFLGSIGPVRARVLDGAGVAVLPHYFVQADLKRGRLVQLMPKVKLPVDWFRLVWPEQHPRASEIRDLAAELADMPLR